MTVESVCTRLPDVLSPKNTVTLIVDERRGAVRAVPEKLGLALFVVLRLTGLVIFRSGGPGWTDNDLCAGVGSALPVGLIARIATACRPSTSAP